MPYKRRIPLSEELAKKFLFNKMEGNLSQGTSLETQKEVAISNENIEGKSLPESNIISPHSEIPNGGWLAWLQVFGSFFIFFNSWGM